MRDGPASYRLTFILPAQLSFAVRTGIQHPCLHRCSLNLDAAGLVTTTGPSRELVFDQAARFLRRISKGLGPFSIAGKLATSATPSGSDSWSIIIGAEVAFSPTALNPDIDPHKPQRRETSPPDALLELIGEGDA